jgi:hypothetical protein
MRPKFSIANALALVSPVLHVGEQILARARGYDRPWCGRWPTPLADALTSGTLVVATNQRLLLLEHTASLSQYTLRKSIVVSWPSIERVHVDADGRDGTLLIEALAHSISRNLVLPNDWLRGNLRGATAIMALWQAGASVKLGQRPSFSDITR